MVPTHKTTLLSSNCPGIGVIPVWRQRQQRLVSSLSLFPQFSFPPASPLFPPRDASLILSEWGERTDLDQLSSGFPKLKQPAHILDHISGSHYFFFLRRERERGWLFSLLLHISCWRGTGGGVLVWWWSRCSEEQLASPTSTLSSRASWIPGASGGWSLLSWQLFRLCARPCCCATARPPHLLKVRGDGARCAARFFVRKSG